MDGFLTPQWPDFRGLGHPKGNTLTFQYDSQERLTQVTNQLGLHWTFERDVAGRVIRETDFDGRVLTYQYDPGGRVIRRDNPDGAHLEYDYDKSGLLTKLRAFAPDAKHPEVTTYEYDDTGALAKAANGSATIELERDALGRVIAETTNGTRIESEIDCCGRRIKRNIGDQIIDYAYDGMGGLTEWALKGHEPLSFKRSALGLETQRTSRKGFILSQEWDAVGQLLSQKGWSIGRDYQWSKGYDPVAIKDGLWGEKRYDYDPNGQITQTQYSDGSTERFGYNKDLNLAATGDHAQFLNWQTSAAGVVRLARGPKGEIVKLEHDVCGRVIKRTVERNGFRPQTWTFAWNAQDQLIKAHCPDGAVWAYEYDPFGRRVSKSYAGTRTEFVWDGDVLALEHCDGVGTEWFFEPDSFRPMAKRSDGKLRYIVTDHLGTPKEMVTEAGQLVWAVDHDTWGTVRKVRAGFSADAPEIKAVGISDFASNTARQLEEANEIYACPIRFQGQWEDAETGLYYNRFRYYEPLCAAYFSDDPIGILGGIRPSGFTNSPTTEVDELGLSRTFVVYRGREATTGLPYIGCASAPSRLGLSPRAIISRRYGGDFSKFGGTAPDPLWSGTNRNAARGLEQHYFEETGGVHNRNGSNPGATAANRQSPVGPNNKSGDVYRGAARAELNRRGSSTCCPKFGPDVGKGSDIPC